jgi:hypothetical protein
LGWARNCVCSDSGHIQISAAASISMPVECTNTDAFVQWQGCQYQLPTPRITLMVKRTVINALLKATAYKQQLSLMLYHTSLVQCMVVFCPGSQLGCPRIGEKNIAIRTDTETQSVFVRFLFCLQIR